ncbi:MAG: hypothetical protein AAF989_12905 [Planctomycetota bacterium]
MSDFSDFRNSAILRHPTTWLVALAGFIYGGYNMYAIRELRRAEGTSLETPWLATDRALDVVFGGMVQVAYLMGAVWMIAGFFENASGWIRQSLVVLLYLGLNWLTQYL